MYLPSKLHFRMVKVQSRICQYSGVLPFVWNASLKLYQLDPKTTSRFLQTTLICIIQLAFLIAEVIRLKLLSNNSDNLYYFYLLILALTLAHFDFYLFYSGKEDIVTVLNLLHKHTYYVAGKLLQNVKSYFSHLRK